MAVAAAYDNISTDPVAAEVDTPRDDNDPDDKQAYDDEHNYADQRGNASHPTVTYNLASASRWACCPV
ncbi:MAG TPA: hypothetical protein VGR06_29395 [Actinophytocola sp.]|uniref:hypothetical protein n=1 Tax=Actinophytocola sp. TaxID=1872138 RepID=UPI002E03A4A3|nr:hypothetical protein [Actinophytocola sp.]